MLGFIVLVGGCMDASLSQEQSADVSISAQDVPPEVETLDLAISGSGMGEISATVDRSVDAVVLSVPTGPDREFDGVAAFPDSIQSFAKAFSDRKLADVPPQGVQVPLSLLLSETQLVVGSPHLSNNIGMREDRSDTVTSIADYNTLGLLASSSLRARDLDFDEQGRLFVANTDDTFSSDGGVFQISDINDTADFVVRGGVEASAVAVDSEESRVYFVDSGVSPPTLQSVGFDGSGLTNHDLSDLPFYGSTMAITGLDAGPGGDLYISGFDTASSPLVSGSARFDPDSDSVVSSYDTSPDEPYDVLAKGNNVYVLRVDQSEPSSRPSGVYQLTRSMSEVDSLATTGDPTSNVGEFDSPVRFTAKENSGFYVVDDGDSSVVVYFEDMSGSGWQTLTF
jgi:hypothetical protein